MPCDVTIKFNHILVNHGFYNFCLFRLVGAKKEAGTFDPTSSQKENIFLIHVFL